MRSMPDADRAAGPAPALLKVAHLTTVDLSLRYLVWPQLLEMVNAGGESIGISSPGPWVDDLSDAGVRHIALESSTRGFSLLADFRAMTQLWSVLRREDFTILHTHNPKPGVYGRILGRMARVPVVVNTVHGFYATSDDSWPKRAVVYSLEWLAARFSDAELHQNPEDLELATRLRLVAKQKIRLLGNGVDLSRFDASGVDTAARSRIRHELGAYDSDIVVGTVGRLVAEKGYLELFETARRLGKGYVFVGVGPTDLDKSDAITPGDVDTASSAGFRLLGMRTDMPELYSAMDVFVLASHREGFPRAAMEAAAMGLPVVATDIRGCRQVVEDGVNGLLVPVENPARLAHAIARIGDDDALREKMGVASKLAAAERFDERKVVDIVMDTYRQALADKNLAHMIPEGMIGGPPGSEPRRAVVDDAGQVANLHVDTITTGFLNRLGRRFMRVLYRGLISWPRTHAYVFDDEGGVVGFVVGVENVGDFYKWFLKRHWFAAGISALPSILNPRNILRAIESLRYGGDGDGGEVPAEVLSLGVAPRARRKGLSTKLLEASLGSIAVAGQDVVQVVVGSENVSAIRAYEHAGFVKTTTIEVHRGEVSEVLVWHQC